MKFVGAAALVLVVALAACSPIGEATPNPVPIRTPTNLTSSPRYEFHPSWSPDGRRIAFQSPHAPDSDIYVINVDGSGLVHLTNNPVRDSFESWSPDAQRIAFTSDRDGNSDIYYPDIYIVNADGSGLTRLTDSPGWDGQSSWSPDGRRIAFVSDGDSNPDTYNSNIYIVNADGSGLTRLTDSPGFDRRHPSWSPDGRHIAFTSDRDGNCDIYTINTDGSDLTRLTPFTVGFTDNPRVNYQLRWFPDGRRIAFTSEPDEYGYSDIYNSDTYNSYIYIVNADGSGLTRLTDRRGWDYDPSWSPDGRRIAFASERDGNGDIYIVNVADDG